MRVGLRTTHGASRSGPRIAILRASVRSITTYIVKFTLIKKIIAFVSHDMPVAIFYLHLVLKDLY